MWYESITVRSWRMAVGVILLVGLVLATLPAHSTLAVNSTGETGATHASSPPCGPLVAPRTQSIDGVVVKAEGPRGTSSAYNPASAQAQPTAGADKEAASMADQHWTFDGMITAPFSHSVGMEPWHQGP